MDFQNLNRRKLLQQASLFAGAGLVSLGAHAGWVRTGAIAQTSRHAFRSANGKRLIVIFLRGAVDGLSLVVPHQEAAYYEARPTIAIAPPGQSEGAIDLNGQFGLHPQLKMLLPLWEQQQLAIVHNCGLPRMTRSHFEAQNMLEMGIPNHSRTTDGWMNRLLALLAQKGNPIQAINVGNATPRILTGPAAIATLAPGRMAERKMSLDREHISTAFDRLYDRDGILGQTYEEARKTREALQAAVKAEATQANDGAPLPKGFARDAQRLARMMRQDPRVQLGFFDLGGWDTHVNQGASQGQLARNLSQLGEGLVALKSGLGRQFEEVAIVVVSEFGRTVAENGNGGTDHGQGNVMLVLGGGLSQSGLAGGQVYGEWRGLELEQLNEKRDLPVTVDFRDVFTPILEKHLRMGDHQLAKIFPGYRPMAKL